MAQSLKTYLSNRTDVQGARTALLNYASTYQTAKKQWENTPKSAKNYQAILDAYNVAEAKVKELTRAKDLAESNARVEYDKITSKEETAKLNAADAKVKEQINLAQENINKYQEAGKEVPKSLTDQKTALEGQLSTAPKGTTTPQTGTTGTGTGTTGSTATIEDITAIRDNLADPKNKDLLAKVQGYLQKNVGYTGKADGKWSIPFQNALDNAFNTRGSLPASLQGKSFLDFLASPEAKDLLASGGSGAAQLYGTISNDTQAASLIKSAFKTVLDREPTAEEIANFKKKLNAAEKKNLSKTVNGITTGGLNKDEFLSQEIQKLPEYATKKAQKTDLTKQSILKLARLNGLPTNTDQIDAWTQAVQNGTDIKTIGSQIRQIAGAGLPDNIKKLLAEGVDLDTIYSPYKSTMASTLELNPNDIQLNDPILRQALGPDKEMSIYDFQKILKKDNRWQYTNNARDEVSNIASKVLQDFGFQG